MNIVITGASSGIGLRVAEKLVASGHTVYNISRTRVGMPHMTDIVADLSEPDAAKNAIERISATSGRLDAGIYCAGYSIAGSIRDVTDEDARCIAQVNYLSATEFVRAMERAMCHRGRIILMSSMAGFVPLPYEPYYSATKSAMISYARSLAMEWKNTALSVCCLTPGGVCTAFSRHRQKVYGAVDNPNLNAAISCITDIEQGGLLADDVADKIISLLNKEKMPILKSVSVGNAATLNAARMMPARWTDSLVMKKFNQRKLDLPLPSKREKQPEPLVLDMSRHENININAHLPSSPHDDEQPRDSQ